MQPSNPQWHLLDAHQWRDAVAQHGAEAGIRAVFDRINGRGAQYNAFTTILEEQALEQARELDKMPPDERGPLHGVPVVIKDEVDVAGCVTTFGTAGNSTPRKADSLIVSRLRQAGAVIVAKTTMPAFGAYPFTESSRFGITRNPINPAHTPGGSSGGSAVAVADGIVPIAIGGDGGGSIRIPADHCGIVGLKPARGHIPPDPYEHLWLALGTAGPLTRSVRDARLVYSIIAGRSLPEDTDATSPRPLRIGVSTKPVSPLIRLSRQNRQALEAATQALRGLGHEVTQFELSHPDPTPAFLVQFFAGIREEIDGLEHPERIETRHKWTKALGFWARGPVVRWALRWSDRFGRDMDRVFKDYDVVLTPSVAGRPVKTGVLTGKGPVSAMIASMPSVAYTALWNVSGHPALTIPTGIGNDGLPTSVQLIAALGEGSGDDGGEYLLCRLAEELERVIGKA